MYLTYLSIFEKRKFLKFQFMKCLRHVSRPEFQNFFFAAFYFSCTLVGLKTFQLFHGFRLQFPLLLVDVFSLCQKGGKKGNNSTLFLMFILMFACFISSSFCFSLVV